MRTQTRLATALLAAALFAAGAAHAQLVDPRTAAGAAGTIIDRPAPDIDTPAKIDPSRDPAVNPPAGAPAPTLPQASKASADDDLQPTVDTERPTSAPVFRAAPEKKAPAKPARDGLRR